MALCYVQCGNTQTLKSYQYWDEAITPTAVTQSYSPAAEGQRRPTLMTETSPTFRGPHANICGNSIRQMPRNVKGQGIILRGAGSRQAPLSAAPRFTALSKA